MKDGNKTENEVGGGKAYKKKDKCNCGWCTHCVEVMIRDWESPVKGWDIEDKSV